MNEEALIIALLAAYEAAKTEIPYEDEDFKEDTGGDWVRLMDGSWASAREKKEWLYNLLPQDRYKDHREEKYQLIDAMTHHSMVTSLDHRRLRYARKRAKEILSVDNNK